MVIINNKNFDLGQICESGQCFRMRRIVPVGELKSDGGEAVAKTRHGDSAVGCGQAMDTDEYELIAGDKYLRLSQSGDEISFYCGEDEFENFWENYFDLGTDYGAIAELVDERDEYLKNAVESCGGMRILRQPLWETIISFIISQQNNIPRIRRCVGNICAKYGEELKNADGESFFAFPTADALAPLSEDALMECNLGYRSKYVVKTARAVVSGECVLDDLYDLDYDESMCELLKLNGVGEKVANCISLFALHHIDAFPVDTHIRQILDAHYPDGFPFERYRGYNGIMQQYMFYYKVNIHSRL